MSEIPFFPDHFLEKSKTYALVGSSSAWQDHSYHLFLALEKEGYNVTPLSTTDTIVCGVEAYPSLVSIPPVDGVIFSTTDEYLALKFLKEMRDTGLYKAWFEDMPDMVTPAMEDFIHQNTFQVVQHYNMLDMLQKGTFNYSPEGLQK